MIREIKLYGTLEKVAGVKSVRFDCDNQHQMFAGLKAMYPDLDMTFRTLKTFAVASTQSEDDTDPKPIQDGFNFSEKAKIIHLAASTEGAWLQLAYMVIAMVIAYVVVRLTMPHINQNNAGGSRSTMFNGPVNATDQGGPIPIIYGKKVLTGSTIMSADEDYYNTI
jgi:predicted phage tail protein